MARTDRIEAAVAMAEAETGIRSSTRLRMCVANSKAPAARRWTHEEDEFLRYNLGKMTEEQLAKKLRRSAVAVHLRWERTLHLQAPSKRNDTVTAEHVAIGLCRDGKSVHLMIDRGIMPGRRLPTNGRVIRLLNRIVLVKWLLNPGNWAYINPEQVGEPRPRGKRRMPDGFDYVFWQDIRRLVKAKRRIWNDEWLTSAQVSRMLRLPSDVRYVAAAIRKGNLKATRWGNWHIRRSSIRKGMTINFRGEWVPRRKP